MILEVNEVVTEAAQVDDEVFEAGKVTDLPVARGLCTDLPGTVARGVNAAGSSMASTSAERQKDVDCCTRSVTKAIADQLASRSPGSIPQDIAAFATLFSSGASLRPWNPLSTSLEGPLRLRRPSLTRPEPSPRPQVHISLDQPRRLP